MNTRKLILGGKFVLVLGIFIVVNFFIREQFSLSLEIQSLENFYEENDINEIIIESNIHSKKGYIAVLRIPKVDLKQGLFDYNDSLNNVESNIKILDNSSMPDVERGKLFLAAHSGNSKVSYFKNLNKLDAGDEVFVDFKGRTYRYVVKKMDVVMKTGSISLELDDSVESLIMITCVKNSDKQLVIECEKTDVE